MYEKIEASFYKSAPVSAPTQAPALAFSQELFNQIILEIKQQLSGFPRSTTLSLKERPALLKKSKIWNEAAANVLSELEAHARPHQSNFPALSEENRQQLESFAQLRVSVPPSALGALAVFFSIQQKLNLSLEFQFDTISSSDRWKRRADADAIVLSWRGVTEASTELLSNYEAVTLLPQTRFDLIGNQDGDVLLPPELGGYPLELFNHLLSQGVLKADAKPEPASILEIVHFTGENSRAGIVAFPYSLMLSKRKNLPIYDAQNLPIIIGDYILLISRSWRDFHSRNLIYQAFRYAWHELLNNQQILQEANSALIANQGFLQALRATSGLYQEF